MLPRAPIQR